MEEAKESGKSSRRAKLRREQKPTEGETSIPTRGQCKRWKLRKEDGRGECVTLHMSVV
jgi:hypothetical protein